MDAGMKVLRGGSETLKCGGGEVAGYGDRTIGCRC